MDQRKTAKIIFADISKAFEKVWHGGLLYKVHRLGIRGNLLRWLKDCLADCFQRVVLQGSTSSWLKIIAGIPQGSIMGPLLFMIFDLSSPRVMYRETCLETLEERRKNHVLVAFYRLIHSDGPCRMNHSMVRNVSDRNNYRVRNRATYCLERTRTEHHRKSFLPEAIRRWNDLDTSKVNLALKNSLKKNEIPNAMYDVTVTRRSNILLSRLRMGNSDLRGNPFSKMMADTDICECREDIETTDHYLMKCNTFDEQRQDCITNLPDGAWSTANILFGNSDYDDDLNRDIQIEAQNYINNTKRFE